MSVDNGIGNPLAMNELLLCPAYSRLERGTKRAGDLLIVQFVARRRPEVGGLPLRRLFRFAVAAQRRDQVEAVAPDERVERGIQLTLNTIATGLRNSG